MLVLTRKVGERIQIGDDIIVVVTKSAGNRVTLGIEAPRDVRIVRGELEAVVDSFNDGTPLEDDCSSSQELVSAPLISFPFPAADACTFVPTQAR